MQTYREFQPTGLDALGLNADRLGIGHWLVCPTGQNRDSGHLEQSNFAAMLATVGGESDTVQVHRFGHWACGWFEIILIDPADTTAVDAAQALADALEDYPVADEEDLSRREWESACEYWEHASIRERVQLLQDARLPIWSARRDELPEDPAGRLFERLTSN